MENYQVKFINRTLLVSVFFVFSSVLLADDVWFNVRKLEVQSVPVITPIAEVECLAKNIYFEAGHEPEEGKIAVAQVTKNRVQHPNYPKTYCGVVWQVTKSNKTGKKVAQFSWTLDGKSDVPYNHAIYIESWQIAEKVLLNRLESDIIDESVCNYHAVYVKPKWAKYMERVAKIGNHLFYRTKS